MAVGDLWLAKFDLSTHDRPHSFQCYFDTLVASTDDQSGSYLASALGVHFETTLRALISSESRFEGIRVWKKRGVSATVGQYYAADGVGTDSTDALPINNQCRFNIQQEDFDARYNNSFSVSGISANNLTGSDWTAAFLATPAANLVTKFLATVFEVAGAGEWKLINIAKRLPLNPPGDPSSVTKIRVNSRVMSMRPRTTRVTGTSVAAG